MNFGLGLLGAFGAPAEQRKWDVWNKGALIPGYDSTIWRRDQLGYIIWFSDYGDRNSEYGWEIDHIIATAIGGSDDLSNLRPLHFRANAGLGGVLSGLLNR
jgi:hypothetical protein